MNRYLFFFYFFLIQLVIGFTQIDYIDTNTFKSKVETKKNIFSKKKNLKSAKQDSISKSSDTTKTSQEKLTNQFFKINGQITAEYNYGFIPYLTSENIPTGFYRSYGDIRLQTGILPWVFSYNYSNLGSVSGLNNYVKLSFDILKYRDLLKEKRAINIQKLDSFDIKKIQLNGEKEKLFEKKYYLQSLLDVNNINHLNHLLSDSAHLPIPNFTDSIEINKPNLNDSISLAEKKNELQQKISAINNQISSINDKIKNIEEQKNKLTLEQSQYNPKKNSFNATSLLEKIRKFEFGLTNPNLSPLFLNGISLQGIHCEIDGEQYLSISHGVTVSPVMFSIDPVKNHLQYTRNLFNFFDFGNVGQGQRITAIKAGPGAKENTHFHVGILQGIAKTGSYIDSPPETYVLGPKEKNYVIELDIRYQFSKNHFIELFLDKSYLHNSALSEISLLEGYKNILSNNRTNAALAKHSILLPKIKSKITSSIRWIDPYFKNYGAGFLRSDNIRYEVLSEHQVTKKIQINLRYRNEQDNLLKLYEYQNNLTTIGAQSKIKLLKSLTLITGYFPVIHTIETSSSVITNKNHISNAVLTYSKIKKYTSHVITLAYNHFLIVSDTTNNNYQTLQLNYDVGLGKNIRLFLTGQWFEYVYPDSITTNTYLLSIGTNLNIGKTTMISSQVKYSVFGHNFEKSIGYNLRCVKNIGKFTSLELTGEKLVMGDFYNTIQQNDNYRNFPYLFSVKLTNFF